MFESIQASKRLSALVIFLSCVLRDMISQNVSKIYLFRQSLEISGDKLSWSVVIFFHCVAKKLQLIVWTVKNLLTLFSSWVFAGHWENTFFQLFRFHTRVFLSTSLRVSISCHHKKYGLETAIKKGTKREPDTTAVFYPSPFFYRWLLTVWSVFHSE